MQWQVDGDKTVGITHHPDIDNFLDFGLSYSAGIACA